MERPIDVTLPHNLGKDAARERLANNIHKLSDHIPGGAADVTSSWSGDTLNLTVKAMGAAVEAAITVEERLVRCHIMLPGMLALFARPIEAMLKAKGPELLEDHSRKR
ncbi:MAG: polyhydroxyalkanoic acid system family protein [Sphingomicrobium sp.]|nr:polyhydroxyalkanoic acid system family protein [Sphingomonadales bacterium]